MNDYEIVAGFTKGLSDSFAEQAGKRPVQTFNSAWSLVFGGFENYVEKVEHKRKLDLREFKKDLENNILKISKDNVQEPKLSLVGPALESTKFFIHEKEVREMFTKLISKSMDSSYNEILNHSFVEVLKQLSPLDVKLFDYIYKRNYVATAKVVATFNFHESSPLTNNFFVYEGISSKSISLSLDNLNRLGLINIPDNEALYSDLLYKELELTDTFRDLEKENYFKSLSEKFKSVLRYQPDKIDSLALQYSISSERAKIFAKYSGVELIKTNTSLSTYGEALAAICLDDEKHS